jgi:hypothetical protein
MAEVKTKEVTKPAEVIKPSGSVHERLQKVRAEISKLTLEKSGENKYSGFKYFELKDFLPESNKLFAQYGLCPVFTIGKQESKVNYEQGITYKEYEEYAFLQIFNIDNKDDLIVFACPTAENVIYDKTGVIKSQNPIQNLGAKKTYIKRYLYMDALELSERDSVEADPTDKDTKEPLIPIKPKVDNKPTNVVKSNIVKNEVVKEKVEYLTDASKAEIAGLIILQGKDVVETIDSIATSLGTDKLNLLESQKEEIIDIIKGGN